MNFKDNTKQRKDDAQEGLKLLQQYIDNYNKVEYPSVNGDLLDTLMRGLKLLGINHVINIGDKKFCPDCNYPGDDVEKELLSLYTLTGGETLCVYCSLEHEQETIFKHNMGDCDCPDERTTKAGKRCWSKQDCLQVYKGFEEMYNEIIGEINEP